MPTSHTVKGVTSQGGKVECKHSEVSEAIGTTTCTAIPEAGYTFEEGNMSVQPGDKGKINTNCNEDTCELKSVTGDVTVAATTKPITYTVSIKADPAEGADIACNKDTVEHGGIVSCDFTLHGTYKPDLSKLPTPSGANCSVTGTTVTCSGVTDNLDVTIHLIDDGGSGSGSGNGNGNGGGTGNGTGDGTGTGTGDGNTQQPTFRVDTSGGNNSSPTMSELGLLLSDLALAGAAAPALRRREKQGKKADTRQ